MVVDAGAGHFGSWSVDAHGLPCFDYRPDAAGGPLVVPGGDTRQPWHQVGNDRIIATAHAGGWSALYFCDRGYLRLSDTDPSRPERLGGIWSLYDECGARVLTPFTGGIDLRPRWGIGYAEWSVAVKGLEVRRRLSAPFGDVPAVRVDLSARSSRATVYEETWGVALYPLLPGGLMTRWEPPPASHVGLQRMWWHIMVGASTLSRAVIERLRRCYRRFLGIAVRCELQRGLAVLTLTYRGPFKSAAPGDPAWVDAYPKPIFLAVLGADPLPEILATPDRLCVRTPVGANGRRLAFAIGSVEEANLGALVERLRRASVETTAAEWRQQLRLEMPAAPWLEREAAWHAYYLRSAQVRDDYFEAQILPQGSAYSYVHGLHGAIRDYALTVVPMTFLDPAGARDTLRLIMQMTCPDGRMYYAHTGFGKCTSAATHDAPTDLALFFLWALSEHVWATGDSDFLDETVPFYPKRAAGLSTVRERVVLACRYLRHRIGVGTHGMMRVGSGDWSDPIALMVRKRTAFRRRGESGFNTAMAAYVLPRAAALLDSSHPPLAQDMRRFAGELRAAMESAWTGRWFLRGWDGCGMPIGTDHLFLDANVWALIAPIGSEAQRRVLVQSVRALLDDPSPIGATVLDRPHPIRFGVLGRGWDCNGGVWAAINGLLAWGYARHDPALAWRNLEKQSLAAHARAYPHVWYGIWSGPDAYNAHYADRPGETFTHPATPMREFPVMNSNAHALPLLALLRILGVETTRDGIAITPRLPSAAPWRLETPLLSVWSDGGAVGAATRAVNGLGGRAALRFPEAGE
jgi:hypothetical protein